MSDAVAEVRVAPFQIAHNLFRISIEQKFLWIEAMALRWIVGPVDAVSINETGARFRQIAVPDLIGLFFYSDAVEFATTRLIKQTKFNRFGVFGEKSEVNAFAVPSGSEGIWLARPHNGFRLNDHGSLTGFSVRLGSGMT